tara:strand:+ start:47 stop:610 length:564 start_codon:yes stop_codon:yes gene_type:complete
MMREISEFKFIPLDLISYDSQINESNNEINQFIEEIREKGLIRPLIVSSVNGQYILKLGVLRFLAFKKLNYSNIFCGVVEGECNMDEIKAIALCYNELDDMLNFEDKFEAINYLLNYYNQDISKINSKTNISSQEITTLLNYKDIVEKIKKYINQINSLDNSSFLKKSRKINLKELDDLSKFLEKLI